MSSEKVGKPCFVWWRSVGGKPTPQKWIEYSPGLYNSNLPYILAVYPISRDDFAMAPLDELAERFPAPEV